MSDTEIQEFHASPWKTVDRPLSVSRVDWRFAKSPNPKNYIRHPPLYQLRGGSSGSMMRRCRRPDRFIIPRMPGDPLSNNGNGEGIQVDIEPCGRLLRRCTKRAEQTTRARGCSSPGDPETFSLLKEKELCAHLSPSPLPDPGIRLLSRLCLETRPSEFLAERRCLSSPR